MKSDYFTLALKSMRKRRMRSFLTIVGIVIAIATIFVLISISLGLRNAVDEQFKSFGTDKFIIQPKGQAGLGTGGAVELTTKDAEEIAKVNGVKSAAYMAIGNVKIEFFGRPRYYIVAGIPLDDKKEIDMIIEAATLKLDEGRFLEKGDSGKIVVGSAYKTNNLFTKNVQLGDKIKLNEKEFKVIGILKTVGNPSDDQNIFMSYEDFKQLFNSGERIDYIYVQVIPGEDLNDVAENVEKDLRRFRDVNEKNQDFIILTPEEILASFNIILNILTSFLLGIAAISLLVGGIGIANTMYTSVLERTKEIGIMKAIGAKNSDILWIFVIESGLLGLIGGIIGIGLGFSAAKIVEYIAVEKLATTMLKPVFPWYLSIGCILFAFFSGVVSGFFPSLNASKTNTVDALRYE